MTQAEHTLLARHAESLLLFIRDTKIPESSGWPFSTTVKFASVDEAMSVPLVEAARRRGALIEYDTLWGLWSLNLVEFAPGWIGDDERLLLPDGWISSRVPEEELSKVIGFSSIKRQKETLGTLPSRCLISEKREMVAWVFLGIDGSLSTLHVLEEFRGRGLAKLVVRILLRDYVREQFLKEAGISDYRPKGSGYVHSEVGEGNLGSEGVMRSLGARRIGRTGYAGIDIMKMT